LAGAKVLHVGPSIPIHDAEDDEEPAPRWPDDEAPPRRRRAGGWIVSIVMLGAVGFLSFAVERHYRFVEWAREQVPRLASGVAPGADPRTAGFIDEGEHAFARGDLESAQRAFDKASVLSERDPRVLLGEARVSAAKADVPWLRLRLLPVDAVDDARTTTSLLDGALAEVRRTADEALAASPQDSHAIRAKLDALRLSGELDAARGYVVAVLAQASEPETAYVLAALDLAPAQLAAGSLGPAIDRLRVAAAAEPEPGRAEAALIYALAKNGDAAGARTEVAKLDAEARPYPLLPALRAFAGVAAVAPSVTPSASASSMPPAPSSSSSVAPSATAVEPSRAVTAGDANSGLQAAMDAVRRGDFDRAERVYQGLVASNPRDSQALAGLGDVLRMHHDPQGAVDAYKRALAVNPSYVPAALGLADTQWAEGDHEAAARSYRYIADRFPDGSYPSYVNQRAAGP
jgi:tetratricopeptide (TPR) repeat protein